MSVRLTSAREAARRLREMGGDTEGESREDLHKGEVSSGPAPRPYPPVGGSDKKKKKKVNVRKRGGGTGSSRRRGAVVAKANHLDD
jgi:hypothetical protein